MHYEAAISEWKRNEQTLQEKICDLVKEGNEMSERISQQNCKFEETKTEFEKERKRTKEQLEEVLFSSVEHLYQYTMNMEMTYFLGVWIHSQ